MNREQVYELMKLFWSVENNGLQDIIVKHIHELMKEDIENGI